MERNFTFDDGDIPGVNSEEVEQFLVTNNILDIGESEHEQQKT
jgi:hypothetical protein